MIGFEENQREEKDSKDRKQRNNRRTKTKIRTRRYIKGRKEETYTTKYQEWRIAINMRN